jgi:hypothetical protein
MPSAQGEGTASGLQQGLWASFSPHHISANKAYKSLVKIALAIQKGIPLRNV